MMREADAMKKIDELSALLAEAMTKKHPEEEEKLVVVDEAHNSVREEVAHSVAENEDLEGSDDNKPKLDVDDVILNSKGDKNHEEKDDSQVGQQELKTECTVQESNKVAEKEAQADRKQETELSNDELDSKKEDSSTENANGITVSEEVISKVAAVSPTKPQQPQKRNKPLLKKFGSLLKKKNSK
uniref:Uncharacterized protein n=1 Tax=Arundo donax TaxID=35708 RepID=A0A0A9E732_ARUDO